MQIVNKNYFSNLRDIFSDKKVVESHLLNYFGAQVFRVLFSDFSFTIRGLSKSWPKSDFVTQLRRDGMLMIPNFLDKKDFNQVKKEFVQASKIGVYSPIQDGDTRSERFTLNRKLWEGLPAVSKMLSDARLIGSLEGAERKSVRVGDVWFDVVCNGNPKKGQDSQKQLHSDIFFTTHKVWFFLEDVKLEDGPLCFVKGSNRASMKRLMFEYDKSVHFDQLKDYAFRVDDRDNKFLKIKEIPLTCAANTLVIANTRGFHRRGDAIPGRTRKQIHFCIRSTPFSIY